jgi:cupin 2 domain-containing protein
VTIERILSSGHCSAPGFWYDQAQDEWVVLVQGQAQLTFADGEISQLQAGDTLFIPAHRPHRLEKTSTDPPCI